MPNLSRKSTKAKLTSKKRYQDNLDDLEDSEHLESQKTPEIIKKPRRIRRTQKQIKKERAEQEAADLLQAEQAAYESGHDSDVLSDGDAGGINFLKVLCKNINISFQRVTFCLDFFRFL